VFDKSRKVDTRLSCSTPSTEQTLPSQQASFSSDRTDHTPARLP
jgi:hypothetical protein